MTRFEFIRQGENYVRENTLDRLAQKIKPLIESEGKINSRVEEKLKKFLEDKEIKKLNISLSEIIGRLLKLIKSENGGVLPENLENLDF